MAWTEVEWACGHIGYIQLYGKSRARDAVLAQEAGKKCMACWLVAQWEKEGDPRAHKEGRYSLARDIAENKGKRIQGLPENAPVKMDTNESNPLTDYSDKDILNEAKRRGLV